MSVRAYIGLGANLGDAAGTVQAAMLGLATLPTTQLVTASSFYRSAPVGYVDQPDFINAVAAIDTDLEAHLLLDGLLALEQLFGRERSFRNAPRTLDLDLLLYGDAVMHDKRLTLPHPRMQDRSFVLLPLHEIAAKLQFPDGTALATLVAACDQTGLKRL
ncbi:2-amino-4-hydroxy-6-hydroxymethyldihydropteridine diphosphokinase [Chitinimonas sp. BJB300]|uniref:2-amino-4-hydroxy-6- hydroxymethyldihydropteridine diphosphokinase n=1 Tax=Chitinimonas sp. BJB300 TaxID=1559339 RepID=UPI000C0DE348|nr:2-amino-4-hydroxy-6-hydroxymethyldihydropteridine diphosphokinase [Chitinimonas sp. BJB300]PHV10279.1 2-amino-4-hydroxy-6-hydroxymethyldihydropteridine diphosphokinase [Chitinimonas sp. BJB300]TSJ84790.1 2-amino-4-hydroxy-6-hydroxymethyldihydropteridine diphosphokinase [Chitinimonas sp. BJB300]